MSTQSQTTPSKIPAARTEVIKSVDLVTEVLPSINAFAPGALPVMCVGTISIAPNTKVKTSLITTSRLRSYYVAVDDDEMGLTHYVSGSVRNESGCLLTPLIIANERDSVRKLRIYWE
jgi:hypothetical protein